MKLNIGCGNKRIEGYIGLDKFECFGADFLCDVEKEALPFNDNSFTNILLDNVVEHFSKVNKVFKEIYRVSDNGCEIKIITPHFSSLSSWIDPTHKLHLSYFSFDHFCKRESTYYIGSKFEIIEKKLTFPGGMLGVIGRLIFKISPKKYEKKYCFIFRASTLHVLLRAKKID